MESAPLAPWQVDLWLAERLFAPGTALTIVTRFTLPDRTDPDRARAAIARVVDAHPALRAAVDESAGVPRLVESVAPPVRVERLRDRAAIAARLDADHRHPIGLNGPLVRADVLCGADDEAVVVSLAAHHLVFDGVSQRVAFEDFAAALGGEPLDDDGGAYFAYARGFEPDAPLAAPAAARAAEFERRLRALDAPLSGTPGALRAQTIRLSDDAYARWTRLVAESGASASVCAVALIVDALARHEPPALVGLTTDARPRDRMRVVGDFANVVPMFFEPGDVAGRHALHEAVARELREARAMRAEQLARDLSAVARATAAAIPVITFRRFAPRLRGGVTADPFVPNPDAKRPLAFQIIDFGDELAFRLESAAAAIGEHRFEALVAAFGDVLRAAGIAPALDRPILRRGA